MTSSIEAVSQTQISFEVSFSEPQAHYCDIKMLLTGLKKDFVDIKMPVWAPGSYLVREFAKNVEELSVYTDKQKPTDAKKINKNTWRINAGNTSALTIKYRIYAFELSVRTSFVDASHAFLSPTGIFMHVDGLLKNSATISINPDAAWTKISTGLDPVKGKLNTFYAPDFDILYDSPIEVGNQDVFSFTAAGVKHEVAMYGGGNYNKNKLSADMTSIIEAETTIFNENPNKRYVFIVHNTSAGGGGLEHLNSTVLGAKRHGYTDETSYKSFLGLVAHEYFHLWNVKRLRPQALGPFNYDTENYTTNLWIAEGFTAYYDNLMLRRTGIYSPEKYLEILNTDINTVENQPGNKVQPVSEASFDAWIKYYRPNENSRNSTISYYDKGAVIGFILDLEIIAATKGTKSLDDVLKAMYDEYYKKQKRGYTDAEFKAMAENIAGKSLDKIYKDYINGTLPINYNSYLGAAGVYLVNENEGKSSFFLGIGSLIKDGKLTIGSVARGSAAWNNGLNVNDEIIAIDNYRVTATADIEKFVAMTKPGQKLNFLIARDGVMQNIEVVLTPNPYGKYRLEVDAHATAEQLAIRKKWLSL